MNDLLLAIIASALSNSGGAAAKAVMEMYSGLKSLVFRKFDNREVATMIEAVERSPDSQRRRGALRKQLETIGADRDEEVNQKARELIQLLRRVEPATVASIDPATLGSAGRATRSGHGGRPSPPKSVESLPAAPPPPAAPSVVPPVQSVPRDDRLRTANGGAHSRQPGLLGAEPPPRMVDGSESSQAGQPSPQRWMNAELEDHAPDDPLNTGKWYTLAFDVDLAARKTAVGTAPVPDATLFPAGIEEVQLTIQLDSDDFEIGEPTRPLRLGRTGRSRGKARFDISPTHDGASTIKATIHKDGNFVQQLDLTFIVGASVPTAVEITARGRPPSAASIIKPRDAAMSISPSAAGGYEVVVWGSVSARAKLSIQHAFLAAAIDAARQELMKIVMHQNGGTYVFQTGLDIKPADRDFALRTMARAGARLFQQIFFGPAAGADSKQVGDWLRKIASDKHTRLKLQIVAESTPVPWGLLYLGDASSGAKLDWDSFLGMRHVIELIPLQTTLTVSDSVIASNQPDLAVSVNVNSMIDGQMGSDFVARQRIYWTEASKSRRGVRVTERTTRAEVMTALADGDTTDQILYFYCHAESAGLTDTGGPDAACLVLTDAPVTLGSLNLDAPTSIMLRGNPLVFINACESADLSPTFYDGFVPYFMAKGARGVVGTECKTPALFAAEWAQRFFGRFLDGQPLGETFLELRREFLEQHGNPLGLLYAVHCDGDTQIAPALGIIV